MLFRSSTQTTGTAPLVVASTTKVTNLNADLLDGYDTATANTVSTVVVRDASGNFSAGTITATAFSGAHNGTVGATTPNTGAFTTISTSGTVTINSGNSATALANGGTAGSGNIGASGQGFNTIFAKATSAQYADLAENYESDFDYSPGTVVMLGGEKEVTIAIGYATRRIAGVVSTDPAFLMNDTARGIVVPVALTGRVPCYVNGYAHKGDLMVCSNVPGVAVAWGDSNDPPDRKSTRLNSSHT